MLTWAKSAPFHRPIIGDETADGVFRKVTDSSMSWTNKAGRTMLLLAVEHDASTATDKRPGGGGGGGGAVTERIQHQDDFQRRLSHAERGQRGVPDASVLGNKQRSVDNRGTAGGLTQTHRQSQKSCTEIPPPHTHTLQRQSGGVSVEWKQMKEALFTPHHWGQVFTQKHSTVYPPQDQR